MDKIKKSIKKLKARAQYLAIKYPDRVKIIYECRCNTEKKDGHHFDYNHPYLVMKLCRKCHMAEHYRLEPGYNSSDKNGKLSALIERRRKIKKDSWHPEREAKARYLANSIDPKDLIK